jgi:hypothetical protein
MPRLKPVRDVATARDPAANISKLQLEAKISMGAARRYWYGTRDGTEDGEQLIEINFPILGKIAAALGVDWRDLVEDWQSLQGAEPVTADPLEA